MSDRWEHLILDDIGPPHVSILNDIGEQGWELVSATATVGAGWGTRHIPYFKRPVGARHPETTDPQQ